MYIKLTNKCTMECAHCCFADGPRGTQFMSRETFNKALALAVEAEQNITLGGGEPTLHPLLFEFIGKAIVDLINVSDSLGCPAVHIVTNKMLNGETIRLDGALRMSP